MAVILNLVALSLQTIHKIEVITLNNQGGFEPPFFGYKNFILRQLCD